MKLVNLPLRSSSLSVLHKNGFMTVEDLLKAKSRSGVATLAQELQSTPSQALSICREVETAFQCAVQGTAGEIASSCDRPVRENFEHIDATSSSLLRRRESENTHSPRVFSNPATRSAAQVLEEVQQLRNCRQQFIMDNNKHVNVVNPVIRSIVTFCQKIDHMIGGGVALGEVMELVGPPSIGKTQLMMQLAVNASLPCSSGGVQGECLYLDTEGSFSPDRCYTMANALVQHVKYHCKDPVVMQNYTPESILKGIHVFRIHDETCQTSTIHSLPHLIEPKLTTSSPIKLIVVDTIAFLLRASPDYKVRTRTLTTTVKVLTDFALKYDLAVVLANQMTTKVGIRGGGNQAAASNASNTLGEIIYRNRSEGGVENVTRLVPALGETFAHSTTTRILLSPPDFVTNQLENCTNKEEVRECRLIKSPHKPTGKALFRVSEDGIRDIILPRHSHGVDSSKRLKT